MTFTRHPRLLARIAGVFYLLIIVFAAFAYLYVRGRLIMPTDMAQTANNILAHERLYRAGFSGAVVVVICNPPMGLILYELLKVVNRPLALLALVSITISTTLEAVNLLNYITPLFTLSLPEYVSAFNSAQQQALARGPIRLFGYVFSVSLTFFGVFCGLIGYMMGRSSFFPHILGILLLAAGWTYGINSFVLFLALPPLPNLWIGFIAELSLALWLLVVGLNEMKWRAQVQALQNELTLPGGDPAS